MDSVFRPDAFNDRHRQSQGAAHYSGVLVLAFPGQLDSCIGELARLDGVTVSVHDPDRDRLIVVLEASSRERLEALHRRVGGVPGVVSADPIVHYVDDSTRDLSTGD